MPESKPKSHSITLSQAVEGYIISANARGLADNTIKEYSYYYSRLVEFFKPHADGPDPMLDAITVAHIQDHLNSLTTLSQKTKCNIHIALSAMWKWGVDNQLVPRNIIRDIKMVKPEQRAIHPFTKEDVKFLIANVDRSRPYTRPGKRECSNALGQALRTKALIYLLLDTGLRAGEVAALKIKDFELKNLRCKVFGKGSKERIVPFSYQTGQVIWRYLATRGSLTTDADGTRQATVLFAPGTQAQMVLTTGVTQTLTTLNVRATEYTVGERGPAAMPAELPAASGYTYALEYSVDEALAANAVDVRFSQPVLHYVENFLEFPIGMAVPTGYYDRQAGRWIGSENGRVVKIIDEAGGLANLDTDGDGVADNGSVITPTMALTITIAERQQLAALYQAGQSLWRVPLTHFTPWDCNWPFGHVSTFTYDANGYLAAVTNPAGETVQLTHTADGLLTQLRDARQNLHTFTYDAAGRLIRDADPMGGSLELAANSITTTVTTALGRVTAYGSISASTGERRTTRQADGAISTQESRADGTRRAQSADGSVITTTLGPDPRWGMLTPINTLLTTTLPGGLSMRTQVTRSVTLITVTQPFSVSQLNESISVNNRTTLRSYNVSQRTLTTKTAAGRSITVTFDAQDRVTSLRRGDLAPVFFGYDATGLISGTQGAGAEARTLYFVYDSAGNLTGVIDPLGRSIGFGYDAAGRVITHTLPDGQVVHYAYNANGRLSSITPPDRPAHAFEYTAIDQIERITPPDVTAGDDRTQLTYNVDRQLTGIQRPDGQAIALNYDAAGRLINTVLPAAAITYTYASSGDVVQLDRSGGANVSRTYDGFLLTGETWSGPVAGTVTRTTNADLNVTAIGVNGAAPITYQYDADDLLTRAGALTVTRSTQNGLIMGSTLGGVSDAWQYNAFAEPVSYTARYTSTPVLAVRYQRDAIGRITAITETVAGATRVITYAYDLAGRLIGATGAQYTYDANGNRLSVTDVNGARTATYDAQDRLLNFGGAAYTYTAAGEMKTKTIGGQTTAYTYDALGNLIHVTLPAGTTIDYVIDGDDRRVGKRVNGVLVKGWLYEDRTGIAAELDGNNNVVSRFVYGASGHVPDYLLRDGHTYRLITDPLGSVRLVVDVNTGDIVQRLDYDAFGRVLTDTQPGFQPFGFAGGLYDPDTGLVRFGLRDYDAEMGRWTAKDPIGFAGGDTNLYAYVENDPINRHDPLGLWSMEGSVYAGLGVGGKLAVSMEGISFCYEVGLGAGGGVSVDPLEGIDRDSMSVVGELGFKAWIFGGGGKVELDDCGNLVGEGKGCVGPFCGKRKYDALGNEQPQNGFEVSSDVLETINVGREGGVKGLKEMYKNVGFKLEGKVAAKFCVQHKW